MLTAAILRPNGPLWSFLPVTCMYWLYLAIPSWGMTIVTFIKASFCIFLLSNVEYSRACSASQLVRVKTAQPWDLLPIQAQSVRFIAIPSHVWTISINTTDRYSRRPRPNSRTLPPSCPHPGALDAPDASRCQNPNCSVSILSQYPE